MSPMRDLFPKQGVLGSRTFVSIMRHQTDRESRLLRFVAFGMALIGIVIGALDRTNLLPATAVANADTAPETHPSPPTELKSSAKP
jgi:hypothetical protein